VAVNVRGNGGATRQVTSGGNGQVQYTGGRERRLGNSQSPPGFTAVNGPRSGVLNGGGTRQSTYGVNASIRVAMSPSCV